MKEKFCTTNTGPYSEMTLVPQLCRCCGEESSWYSEPGYARAYAEKQLKDRCSRPVFPARGGFGQGGWSAPPVICQLCAIVGVNSMRSAVEKTCSQCEG